MLHILKSSLNSNRSRCYKVRYFALAILPTEKFKISDAQLLTAREFMFFTCWLRSGLSHFMNIDSLSFSWYLVLTSLIAIGD